jgi:putative membrane protein
MKKISLPDIGWVAILLCYIGSFLFLLITGKVYDFLHPRMIVFTIMAVVILIIMAGCFIAKIISGFSSPTLKKGFLIFIIPLFFGYAVRNIDTGAALAQSGQGGMNQPLNPDVISKKYTDVDVRNLLHKDVLEITDETYYKTQFILYENPELFSGKKIKVTGFMYRDEEFKPGRFLLARNIMWCCAADAILSGFICEHEGTGQLEPESWLTVSGILDVTSYFDGSTGGDVKIPKIIVENLSYINPPRNKYIFVR